MRPTAVLSHDPSERTTVPEPLAALLRPAGGRATAWLVGGALVFVVGDGRRRPLPPARRRGARASRRRSRSGRRRCGSTPAPKAVWVTSEKDGTADPARPRNRRSRRQRPQARRRHLRRRDRQQMDLGDEPAAGELLRLDPNSGRVLQADRRPRRARSDRPRRPAASGSPTRAASGITAVNAEAGERLPPRPAAAGAGAAARLGRQGLWVDGLRRQRRRAAIDPGTLVTGEPIRVGRGPAGITVAGGFVWVANSRAGTVTKVDPSLREVRRLDRGRRPAGRDRRRHQRRLGRRPRRRRGHARSTSRAAKSKATRSRSAPNRAPSRSAATRFGSQITETAPSPGSSPEDGALSGGPPNI